jgi:hypothetical protein
MMETGEVYRMMRTTIVVRMILEVIQVKLVKKHFLIRKEKF